MHLLAEKKNDRHRNRVSETHAGIKVRRAIELHFKCADTLAHFFREKGHAKHSILCMYDFINEACDVFDW